VAKKLKIKKIRITSGLFEGKERLKLYFPYDWEIIKLIKTIPGARWDPKERCWHVASTQANLNRLTKLFKDKTIFDIHLQGMTEQFVKLRVDGHSLLAPLDSEDQEKIEAFINWMKYRRYGESTIRTYKELTITYLRFIKPKNATDEVGTDIERFTNEYILPRRLSFSYQNQLVNALKLFYAGIIKQELSIKQLQRDNVHQAGKGEKRQDCTDFAKEH